jgi:endoglucanase
MKSKTTLLCGLIVLAATTPADAATTLYADPSWTGAARQAQIWHKKGRDRDAALMRKLSHVPQAFWMTGGSPRATRRTVDRIVTSAANTSAVPVLVAYNVPGRDCSQYSAGGAKNARAYRRWIDAFATGIGARAAIVIVEPDALAGLCGRHRIANLRAAVDRLNRLPAAANYVDAGHSNWQPAATMAKRLRKVHARAAALNVSNFRRTDEIVAYGQKLGLHFVVDTSRNGRGPWHGKEDWCNPPRRGLGARPTTTTGIPNVDAFLWIKAPGESDGQCANGNDPPAGRWWPAYALGLARRAVPAL